MRSKVLSLLVVLSMISSRAWADEKPADDQYQALAAQRLKAEEACKKALQLADGAKSGWAESMQALDLSRAKIQATFQNAIRAEQAKPDGERDPALIVEFNGQLQQLDQDWQVLLHDRAILANTYTLLGQDTNRVRAAMDSLIGVERNWKEAGLDLTGLGVGYDTLSKTMDGYCAQAEQAIGTIKAKQKEWEGKLDLAVKAVAQPK